MKNSRFRHILLLLLLWLLAEGAQAQYMGFGYYQQVPVQQGGQRLKLPWAGGLQAPQFGRLDLNNDGIRDLVVFDRYDGSLLTFLNNGSQTDTAYTFAPEYAAFFPQDLRGWLILHDYNCDGREDIFTAGLNSIRVFRNSTGAGGSLSFVPERQELRAVNGRIPVPDIDMPAITDVDGDGDPDLLAFPVNSNFVSYYRNMRVEQNLPCDSLRFQLETSCWGRFEESATSPAISLNVSCKSGGRISQTNRHAGSTILALDADNDGDMEVLIGDVASDNLIFLLNGGSATFANMTGQTTAYPSGSPAAVYTFPAAFLLDVDNDQVQDLLVAPNSGGESGYKNYEQVLYYRNTGTNASPSFSFRKNNFLGGEMIEVGAGAAPAFTDYDRDGDLDLVIGNYGYEQSATSLSSRLALFRNTGTSASPTYELVSTDFASLGSLNLLSLAPAFGDLDGDGDDDLLLGELNGTILFYRNTAPAGQPAVYTLVTNNLLGQSIGGNSIPHLADLDGDGDLDLLIGERNGNINFYRNTGTAASPAFTLVSSNFGGINVRNPQAGAGYSAPCITDLNRNGLFDLLVGDIDGRIRYYPDVESNLSVTFTESSLFHTNSLSGQNKLLQPGLRVVPAALDVTSDGIPELFAGLYRGGLQLFTFTGVVSAVAEEDPEVLPAPLVYPNPATGNVQVQVPGPVNRLRLTVRDPAGKVVHRQVAEPGQAQVILQLEPLPAGIYLLEAEADGRQLAPTKIMKLNH